MTGYDVIKRAMHLLGYSGQEGDPSESNSTALKGLEIIKQLLPDLKLTKTALDDAYSNFEQVVDPDLVDSYIYEVNAVQKRYHFLLKQVQMLDLQNAIEGELAAL